MRSCSMSVLCAALAAACVQDVPGPDARLVPSFAKAAGEQQTIVVNPDANGSGVAATIQEGIDRVAPGGTVRVKGGTYPGPIVIDKGLTLEGIGDGSGPVIIEHLLDATAGTGTVATVSVTTTDPVVIRDVTVHHRFIRGINGLTAVQLTIENVRLIGEWPPAAVNFNNGVSVVNKAADHNGLRARLEIRGSNINTDGIGISLGGDVDALIEDNVLGGAIADRYELGTRLACLRVSANGQGTTVTGAAVTNVDFVNNELIDCGINNAVAINIATDAGATATGTINIVGNTFRYTNVPDPLPNAFCNSAAITYQFYSGRIEHNTIIGATRSCANSAGAAAIRVGNAAATPTPRAADVVVRFNDVSGNMFAGLLARANQASALNATCNWWGSASGPSGLGSGSGDAVAKEGSAATPVFTPFATAPIAGRGATSCE